MHSIELSETTNVEFVQGIRHYIISLLGSEFSSRKTQKTIAGENWTGWFPEDFTLAEIRTLRVKERFPFRSHLFDGLFQVPILEVSRSVAIPACNSHLYRKSYNWSLRNK